MEQYSEKIKSVVELLLSKGAKPLAFGRHKAVFVKGNLVYRIPKSFHAINELIYEDEFVKYSKKGKFSWKNCFGGKKVYVLLPRMRLISINGVMVQVMEKLVPLAAHETHKAHKKHKWLPNLALANDGEQAGFNRKSQLRCYDFANLKLVLGCDHKVVRKADIRYKNYLDMHQTAGNDLGGVDSNWFRDKGLIDSYGCPPVETVKRLQDRLAFV